MSPPLRARGPGALARLLLGLALAIGAPARADDALEAAYQREVATLLAEREALRARSAELAADRARRRSAAEAELDALQGRLLGLEARASTLESALRAQEAAAQAAADRGALLDATAAQAAEATGLQRAPEEPVEAFLGRAFTAAGGALAADAAWGEAEAPYFLATGESRPGRRLRWGRIASWAEGAGGGGALLPLGEGRFGLRAEGGGEGVAAALLGGAPPGRVALFLVEGEDQAVRERAEDTAMDVIRKGGPVGLVILVLGAATLLLSLGRALTLLAAGRGAALVAELAGAVKAGEREAAAARARAAAHPTGRVLAAVLGAPLDDREQLQDLASAALLRELPALTRFGSAILVIAAVAPLLGLLGTVTGMIGTFDVITQFGTGDPKMLSGGISEALVTTEFGLIVAIPSVLLGNLTRSWSERVQGQLEQAALELIHARTGLGATAREAA
jgi:biopolymer transport protein ExbB